MSPIDPNKIYTTDEIGTYLKLSKSTMKRLLKSGFIRANKIGGHYRIIGHEVLRLISPEVDAKTTTFYQGLKHAAKEKTKHW